MRKMSRKARLLSQGRQGKSLAQQVDKTTFQPMRPSPFRRASGLLLDGDIGSGEFDESYL